MNSCFFQSLLWLFLEKAYFTLNANLVPYSVSLDQPSIKTLLSKIYVTCDVSFVWNSFKFWLVNSFVSLISPLEIKRVQETKKKKEHVRKTAW